MLDEERIKKLKSIDNINSSEVLESLEVISNEEVLFKSRSTVYMSGEKLNNFNRKNTIGNEFKGAISIIKQFLQRLEAIENTDSSEALEDLERIRDVLQNNKCIDIEWVFKQEYNTIKQALLKLQWLEHIHKIHVIEVPELSEEDKEKLLKEVQTRMPIILKDNNCQIDYIDTDMLSKDYNKRKELNNKEEMNMKTKMYIKDTRSGKIYEMMEKLGPGWYRCYDLQNMNETCFVEYNGKRDPNTVLIESDNLKELVDVYAKNGKYVYGFVKVKNEFGADNYIAATIINDDGTEMLVAKWTY